jgi:hypothetical protein
MADNVNYTPGSGVIIAADDIGGVLHQRMKLSLGADGFAVDATGDGTNGLDVDVTRLPRAGTGITSTTAASTTSVTLKVANANRQGIRIYNDSSAILYLKFGTTASASDFTAKVYPEGYFEDNVYTGIIDSIWSLAIGNARVTELT